MIRRVARMAIATTATALIGTVQPLPVTAAGHPPAPLHTRNLIGRDAPGSITALPRPVPRARLGTAGALVAGVGSNIQISPADGDRYSTTAATYDPTNHANIFASSNVTTGTAVAGYTSTDSGSSWSMRPVPLPDSGPARFGFYPGAAFNADGTLYASFMSYNVSGTSLTSQIVVSKSLDKGRTWAPPKVVEPSATNAEKPLIAVDTTASPYRNRIYIGYDTNPTSTSEPLVVSHSDDGVTWSRTPVADTGGDFGAAPAVGPNGDAYVAWDDWCASNGTSCTSPGHILLAKSSDGGMSWSSNGLAPSLVATTSIGFEANVQNWTAGCNTPPLNPTPAPSIDVDRSGGVHNGSVHVAWGDQPQGGRMHIYYARSVDGGAHFSAPMLIDSGNVNDAWQPAVSVDQSNGAVIIAWYDRRDDPGNKLYRPYYTQSTDGGATFLTSQVPVSTIASDPTLSCLGTGDYMQILAVDGIAYPFWSDTRNGRNQIFTATLDEATLAQIQMLPPRLFGPASNVPAGSTPVAVATGDFNGDGNLDMAVTNGDTTKLSILTGDGKGGFALGTTTYPLGYDPEAIVSADLNGDGKLDLAIANTGSGNVSIFIGNGDGTFKAPVSYAAGSGDYGLATADLNNDGKLDLVTANYSDGGVSVLINNGDGTFKLPVKYPTGYATTGVAIGDFNHDGHPDLAAAVDIPGGIANVAVLLNDGQGIFQPAVKYNAGDNPYTLVVGDFSGNGNLDLAVANLGPTISVLMGNANGTFQATRDYPYPGQARSMISIDINGDGKLDLALAGFAIMLGKGDGSFGAVDAYDANARTVAAADLNRDGRLDLIGANTAVNSVAVVLGTVPRINLSPSTISFAAVPARDTGASRSINVTNSGSGNLRIATAEVAGVSAQDFAKASDSCSGATLPAGGNCTVSLRFTPKTVGIKTAALQLTDDAAGSPQLVPLSGKALIKWPRPESAPPTTPVVSPTVRGLPPLLPPAPPGPRSQPLPLFRLLRL